MKPFLLVCLFAFLATLSEAQVANENTLTTQIDGQTFTAQPRRVKIGRYWWMTANTDKPDKSLRIWLARVDGQETFEPGNYLVVGEKKAMNKDNMDKVAAGKYKGVAVIRYVEETKSPRMEYHVGDSQEDGDATVEVLSNANGVLEGRFSGTLAGSYWKEKGGATVFGGVGRIVSKLEDKVITKSTGYDVGIDPEGNGYKRQDKTDQVVLKNGTFKLKMP